MRNPAGIVGLSLMLAMGATSAMSAPAETTGSVSLSLPQNAAPAIAGHDVRVDVTLTNHSKRPIPVAQSNAPGHAEFNYKISVTRADGQPVARTDYGLSLEGQGTQVIGNSNRLVMLQPGASLHSYFLLNQVYDLGRPGTYRVQVTPHPAGGEAVAAASNTLEIAVH
ncbi:MAG TPA: hypothetical protein VG986_17310 [Pseudolabrys sp.]|nr:hypothetical protein [Pseudolabrys sp.]